MQDIDELKENFLSSINHTLTQPVQQSMAHIDQLLQSKLNKEQTLVVQTLHETLGAIHKNSQNLTAIADIKARSFDIAIKPFSPIETFEKIIESFIPKAEAASVHLIAYIDPNAPKEIFGDAKRLTQVMENLIQNGIDFTHLGGSVYVDVKIKHITDTRVSLNVSVTDTGVGIDKNKIKTYLQPFSQSSKERLGVGLSASFYILKSMGTQLKIASELNKGSRFSFALDLKSSLEAQYTSHPDIKIGIYIDDRSVFSYAKLLYQYIISMGLAVVSIKDTMDPNIAECQGLFFVTNSCDAQGFEDLKTRHPKTTLIPTVLHARQEAFEKDECAKKLLVLPALPSTINACLAYVEESIPEEITQSHVKDHQAIKQIAKQAKREKVKILIVEDNPINLKLVKVILSRYDFEVDAAENGQIGVDCCKKKHYDMVLMDIDMPVMDGITATQKIKAYEKEEGIPETPIIALTSHDLAGERTEIMESGLDEHMPKPLNVTRLELMLENYLGYKPQRSK